MIFRPWHLAMASVLAAMLGASTEARCAIERNIVYAEPEGEKLLMDVYRPETPGPHPAVLVIHGGSWKRGDKTQLMGYAYRLAARGYVAFAINYRLAPKHKYPAQIDDCRAALRWIVDHADEYDIDPNRIGAIGYSAGAHLSFLLGVAGDQRTPKEKSTNEGGEPSVRLKAVVAGGSPCDFTVLSEDSRAVADFLGGSKRENPQAYIDASPRFYISADDPPILFFHGTGDDLVTIKGPEIMVEEFGEQGVEATLVRVDGGNHITAAMNLPALQAALAFFDKHLKD